MTTKEETHSYYEKSNLKRLETLSQLAPESFSNFFHFNDQALAEGYLSVKLKELIAVAVAHVTGCAYCIDLHVTAVKKAGASKEELSEAIFVATALKAGASFAHSVNALNAYDDNEDEDLYKASYFERIKEFARINQQDFSAFIDFDKQALKAGVLTEREKELIAIDRKSTRLNSSHVAISYAVFCLKKKKVEIVANMTSAQGV